MTLCPSFTQSFSKVTEQVGRAIFLPPPHVFHLLCLPSVYLFVEGRKHFSAFPEDFELVPPFFSSSWLLPTGQISLLKEPFLPTAPSKYQPVSHPHTLQDCNDSFTSHFLASCESPVPRNTVQYLLKEQMTSQRTSGSQSWKETSIFLSDDFSGYKTWTIHTLQNDQAVMMDKKVFSMYRCGIIKLLGEKNKLLNRMLACCHFSRKTYM